MPCNVTGAQGTAQCHYRVLVYPDMVRVGKGP